MLSLCSKPNNIQTIRIINQKTKEKLGNFKFNNIFTRCCQYNEHH